MCHQTRGGIPISIHSLRVEGDKKEVVHVVHKHNFNPLPPCGGRQNKHFVRWRQIYFNPLPPCGGRPDKCDALEHFQDFNPLPPCGGRLVRFCPAFCIRSAFQSTPSVWRETALPKHRERRRPISIHSLRVEGDQMFSFGSQPIKHFNPLPPCGGRRKDSVAMCYIVDISIHSLRVEGDMPCIIPAQRYRISIHSLRVEGDTMAHSKCYGIDISIHSLRVEGDG